MASCSSQTMKKKAKREISEGPNWLDLPRDITQNILQRLNAVEIVTSASLVCALWWNICKEPLMWRTIHMGYNDRCPCNNMDLFSEVANKFPLLEELDISFSNISKDSLEFIGRFCPLLKSLKFSRSFFRSIKWNDALAIAKTMPKLRYLSMIGNTLTNDELLVILDRCPLLEYLDLRICFRLDLSGSLKKRCRDQIKYLILPIDVVGDCDEQYYDYYISA
ncbi:putative F-box/LRR-repeat protein 23 [Medicago truncatula]|nr:putative F-box/LRR-repeat protein 23 [Medicago truncatula]KEH22429.1 F-box/LRR protein [Medicago truncatula]